MNNQTRVAVLALIISSTASHAQQSQPPFHQMPGVNIAPGNSKFVPPQTKRMNELRDELIRFQTKARRLHVRYVAEDRPKIERILIERTEVMPDIPDLHLDLAAFYEDSGRYREALEEVKVANRPTKNTWSSALENPTVLCHYAELAERLDDQKLAVDLYKKAAGSLLDGDKIQQSDIPRDHREALRQAAHYASAQEYISHGMLSKALADFKIATPLMNGSYTAHLGYARLLHLLGHTKDAKSEFRIAERLAPNAASKQDVHKERIMYGYIEIEIHTYITNGVMTSTRRELPDTDK